LSSQGVRRVAAGELSPPDSPAFSTSDALAVLAAQFGQLAVLLADGADQPFTQQRLIEFAVPRRPGRRTRLEHPALSPLGRGEN